MNFVLLCFILAFLVASVQGNLRQASRVVGKPCTYTESIHGPTYKGVCKFGNQCPSSVSNIQAGIKVPWCYNQNNIMVLCCNAEKRISQVQCDKMTSAAPPAPAAGPSKTSTKETQTANTDKLYPFVVVLEHVTSRQKTSWSCTGALISPNHVLTSAKCISDHEPKQVLAGSVHLFRLSPGSNFKHMIGQQERQVAQVIKHPDYNSGQAYNDIAIVKLAKPFQITEDVAPICLASPSMMASSPHNFPITTLGWGHAKDDESSDTVQPVDIQKWDWNKCREWGDKFRQEVDEAHNTIPTGMSKGHGCGHRMERCDADSGGPVIANHGRSGRNYLVGIVTSSVTSCSTADAPVVYSNVQSYLSWIEQTVWGSGLKASKSSGQLGASATSNTGHKLAPQHQSSRNMGQSLAQFQQPNMQEQTVIDQQQTEIQPSKNHSTQVDSEKTSSHDQLQSERDLVDSKPLELNHAQPPVQLSDHQQPAQLQPQGQWSMQHQQTSGQSRSPIHETAQNQSSLFQNPMQSSMKQSSQNHFQSPQPQNQDQTPIKLTKAQYQLILQQMAQSHFQSSPVQQSIQNPQTPIQQPGQGSQQIFMQLASKNQQSAQNQQQQSPQASGQNLRNPMSVQFY